MLTSTHPLGCHRTPRPGSVRVCVCSLFFAGSAGPAYRAFFGAPHLSFGSFVLLLCFATSGLGLPFPCPPVCPLFFLSFFPFFWVFSPSPTSLLLALPLSSAFCGFQPWVPLALVLCVFFRPPPSPRPNPFFVSHVPLLSLAFSGLPGVLGLGAVRFPSPPPLFFPFFAPAC